MAIKMVILAGEGISTNIIYHALQQHYHIDKVIMESSENKTKMLKRRIKRLGIITVGGQVLFQTICVPVLRSMARDRRKSILSEFNLNEGVIPEEKVIRVSSVNTKQCRKLLNKLNPDAIIVNGTRIISKRVLNSTQGIFINTHAGITPKYRGVHGGYWALAMDDRKNCGVTVHLVDPGIDTGSILYQGIIQPTSKDNFTTYPLLQIASGIPLLKRSIDDFINKKITIKDPIVNESRLWYHPTIWFYLFRLFSRGVR